MTAPQPERLADRERASRRCAYCHEPFAATRPLQKFCRLTCRRKAFTTRGQPRLPFDTDRLFDVPFEE